VSLPLITVRMMTPRPWEPLDVHACVRAPRGPRADARLCRDARGRDGGFRKELAEGIKKTPSVGAKGLGGDPGEVDRPGPPGSARPSVNLGGHERDAATISADCQIVTRRAAVSTGHVAVSPLGAADGRATRERRIRVRIQRSERLQFPALSGSPISHLELTD
jgi:hypothetical protein